MRIVLNSVSKCPCPLTRHLGSRVKSLVLTYLDLLRLRVRSLLDLVLPFLGESDAGEAQRVSVAGFH